MYDEMEIVLKFAYLGGVVSSSGGREIGVPVRIRFEWIKYKKELHVDIFFLMMK